MFSTRWSKCCCCSVRTGSMVIALLGLMSAGAGVVVYSMGLVTMPQTFEALEQQREEIRGYYNNNEITKEDYMIYTSVIDAYEHLLPPVLKGSLAVSAFDLFVSGLLLAGLLTRKAGLMLPWLATAMLYLSVAAAFFLGLTVIQFTVVQSCSGGLFTVAGGLAFVMIYYYIWKVVQSEWMNIREAATRTGQVIHHGKEGFSFHKFENPKSPAALVIDPPPKYPGLEGV